MNRVISVILLIGAAVAGGRATAEDSAAVKKLFDNPPRQYSTGPLWVWNDMLTEAQITSTLEDLAKQKVKQVWVHPRPGLMTPYLGEDWFRLWKVSMREAERLDMNVWIYDENSYPSGFAGGLVPEAMPESRGQGLHLSEATKLENLGDDVLVVYRLTDDGFENVTKQAKAGEALPEAKYLVGRIVLARTSAWFGGTFYVDLLHPGVTEKFLEITMGAYERELKEHFGKRIPGVFTDEPHLRPAGGLHWSERLPRDFKKRWGYDLMDHLPSLVKPVGEWKRVRHNYYNFLLEEFITCWAKPFHDYCEKNNLALTGHYWEHGWPRAGHGGDNMAMYAWHQWPAIDTLMNTYSEGVNAQFGNVRAVKELGSVANQMGRKRTLCEAYGAGGWDFRYEDMKRIGDWLYVLGVNTLNEHLTFITIRGARKRDHPQSFSYHTPWWDSYHVMAAYFTRLSLALSAGKEVNHVLVIEPTSTSWMYQGEQKLNEIGNSFQKLVTDLSKAQVEYDIGCEDIIMRHGKIGSMHLPAGRRGSFHSEQTLFVVGQRAYSTIVLSPGTENLNSPMAKLLGQYVKGGGRVLCCGKPSVFVDGKASEAPGKLAEQDSWQQIDAEDVPEKLAALAGGRFSVRQDQGCDGILYHQRRQLDDGDILFLTNTSIDAPAVGEITAMAAGIERWDPATGAISAYPFTKGDKGIKARFELAPCGSLLLFISKEPGKVAKPQAAEVTTIEPAGPPKMRRVEPNVLPIDYVDVTAGGETKKDAFTYGANHFVFQKNGMDRNPWDNAVQLRDTLITKKFPADSGFEATYRFAIEGQVPKSLWIVIERSDLYTTTCNGKSVTAAKDSWWLDKAFGKIDIAAAAKLGENAVTIKASPMTIYHELEPAYILGDFRLKAAEKGHVITGDAPLKLGPWNEQGHPFYATGAAYTETFNVAKPAGRYYVSLPKWYGSVAKVNVNGKPAGHIAWQPWQCDVTGQIKSGRNEIEVVVIGTLKNTLGPHHGNPGVGRAWPSMFRRGPEPGPPPGEQYHTLGYGLFDPFVLKNVR